MAKFEVRGFCNSKLEGKYCPKFETYTDAINYISRVVKAIKDEVTSNLFDPYLTEFKSSCKLTPDADMNALTFEYTVDGKLFVNRWEIHELEEIKMICKRFCSNSIDPPKECKYCRFFDPNLGKCNPELFD